MTTTTLHVVDEGGLPAWRAAHLVPAALLPIFAKHPVTLLQIPTGTGKSYALDVLLSDAATYTQFGLIVYLAATHAILDERSIIRGTSPAPQPWLRLVPRPRARCGRLDPEWSRLERMGCSTYAKATLCRGCPERTAADPCTWPIRLAGIEKVRLIFATEAQLTVNPNLLLVLRMLTSQDNTLVILDEAKLLESTFRTSITRGELGVFADVVQATARSVPDLRRISSVWLRSIRILQAAPEDALRDTGWRFPAGLHRFAHAIQKEGLRRAGDRFRFIGFELTQFAYSRPDERWRDVVGTLHFTARPYLGHRVVVAAAHAKSEYITHRLGLNQAPHSPFVDTRFRHSRTVIYNIKSRLGAERFFRKNKVQVLDFFASLIRRNVQAGRSTLLISKLTFEQECADYLRDRLAGWGLEISFPLGLAAKPASPDPHVVPVIHYGSLGINTFEEYQCVYALNSYYIRDDVLNAQFHDGEPECWRVGVKIKAGRERLRRVVVVDPGQAHRGVERLGNAYLHRLEVDPVLQVAGRVRFFTKEREVILFQMADLAPDLGLVENLESLAEARARLGVPRAAVFEQQRAAERAAELISQGRSVRAAAGELGLDKETLRRWLSKRLNSPP